MVYQSILLAAIFSVSTLAQAQTDKSVSEYLGESWLQHFYGPFARQIAKLPNTQGLNPEDQRNCDQFYSSIRQKGQIKIIMGIGYYDSSEGADYVFDYYPNKSTTLQRYVFGMNATMDIAYDHMYRKMLTSRCHDNLELCEFKETQVGVYKKMLRDPKGLPIEATIEIRNSSVSTEHAQNIGVLAPQQTAKSDATTQWFFGSIPSSDLAIYNGHSRKGGGPDFHPPKLRTNLHVDYSYYLSKTPGLKRLLAALGSVQKPAAFWMMSCDSVKLFSKAVSKAAPGVAYSGTNAVIPGDIPNKGAIAGMDSMLRFQCQSGFDQALHSLPELKDQLSLPQIQ